MTWYRSGMDGSGILPAAGLHYQADLHSVGRCGLSWTALDGPSHGPVTAQPHPLDAFKTDSGVRAYAAGALGHPSANPEGQPLMSVQNRHLSLVDDSKNLVRTMNELNGLIVAYATGTTPPATADVLDHLADLDTLHATACDVYDLTTAELDAARETLKQAAAALTVAEDAWSKAGQEMDEAARACTNAREAAGLVWTANGYHQRSAR